MATRANLAVGIIGSTARAVIWVALGAFTLGAVAATREAFAQEPVQPNADESKVLSKDELATLVGKIALYPDDLVAVVLPASTYPLQVVEAARFLEERKKDSTLKPSDKWDDSVVALLNYPEVVKLMNDDLDWTWKLGDAVINQRADVLDAIQGFRDRAYAAGNLHNDDHQVVQNDEGAIAIKPADPQVVYVPYYDPDNVVVYQSEPVYHYYPYAYPLYYYPYPYGYPFGYGFFWGVTSAFVIGWHSHYVHYYPCGYAGHPYYGHAYYNPIYVRNTVNVNVNVSHGNYVWQPHYVHGAQPFTRSDGRQLAAARHDSGGMGGDYHSGGGTRTAFRSDGHTSAGDPRGDNNGVARGPVPGHDNNGHDSNGVARGPVPGHDNNGHDNNGVARGPVPGHDNNGHDNNGVARGPVPGHNYNGHDNNGVARGSERGASMAWRDDVQRIQPTTDRVTAQAFRDELHARESNHAPFTTQSHATFAEPSSSVSRSNGNGNLARQHGSPDVERHTVIPQQQRFAYSQQAPDHSAALRASPPVRTAPVSPTPYYAPRMVAPRPSGGESFAGRAPQSAPAPHAEGGRQGGASGHGSQGHSSSGHSSAFR